MVYYVRKTYNNGYYCGCCSHSWDVEDSYNTLEEALKEMPEITDVLDLDKCRGDAVLEKVEVENGANGEEVASWSLTAIMERKGSFKFWHVYGYKPNADFQSIIYEGSKRTDLTSKQAYNIIEKSEKEKAVRDTKVKLDEAQKNYDWAVKMLKEFEEKVQNDS